MKGLKKAIVLVLAICIILAFENYSLARAITNNSTNTNNTSNTSDDSNNTANDTNNNTNNSTNTENETSPVVTNNTPKTINSSNVAENLPNTGISSAELNLALILLLALVFGMFSLVQYNKIVKRDNEE